MRVVIAALAAVMLAACSAPLGSGGTASAARSATASASAPSASPTAAGGSTSPLTCTHPVTATHGLALFEVAGAPLLEVLDVSNPLKPILLCMINPAEGGRFDRSSTRVAYWLGNQLAVADLATERITPIGQLPVVPTEGVFSPDATQFAYRVDDGTGALTLHLFSGGRDRILYTQAALGGHGGPPWGPTEQLSFSADGTELLDYDLFRPTGGPDDFMVFKSDGSMLFHSPSAEFGAWAPTGNSLYFFVPNEGITGAVDKLDAAGHDTTLASSVSGMYWPSAAPSGAALFYTAYDSGASSSGNTGLPHIWRFNIASGTVDQVGTSVSSRSVFVTPSVTWSEEEKACDCGIGGASQPDGTILAHDLSRGTDSAVDTSLLVPGIGGPTPRPPTTTAIVDTWL